MKFGSQNDRFVDDLTGLPLDEALCRAARKKGIDYFHSKGFWKLRTVSEARAKMGQGLISVRWVERNTGDGEKPNIWSRLVARKIRTAGQDAVVSPAPPLESLRMVVSMASTKFRGTGTGRKDPCLDPQSEDRAHVLLIDISRAYFNAKKNVNEPDLRRLPD